MSTTITYGTLFPTGVVGSLPRSAFVRDLISAETSRSDRTETSLNAAVSYAVSLQEAAGLDIVTDGEWRRTSYIGVIAELAHGFETGVNPADGRPWTTVTAPVEPKTPGFVAREAQFLKSVTRVRTKATLPAPALLGERMWDPQRSAGAYPQRRDFVRACVPILRREAELLVAAGVDVVQIDDPHLCLFVDPQVRAQYDDDGASEAAFSVEMNNAVLDGLGSGGPGHCSVRRAVHLCRRAGARVRGEACFAGGYETILEHLNALEVDQLTMEFTSPGAGEVAALRGLRQDFEIGLGCVSVHPGQVDTPQTIVERVEAALQVVDKERILLNPDCGFAPGSAAPVDLDEVYLKLKNQTEAAQLLRQRHG